MTEEKEVQEIIDQMTLMHDTLMSKVFDENIPATELLLRTILGRDDIEVVSVKGQAEYQSPLVQGRRIRLDIEVKDCTGTMSDIEVQRENSGAHPRRARFHSSMLDSRMLEAGEKFETLKDSYTIFITEKDYFGEGIPIYTIERQIQENGLGFEDGSHILYVNGSYDEDDAFGRLMHDFKCKKASDMYYSELAEGVRHFKEEEGGKDEMCELLEGYARKYAADIQAEYDAQLTQKDAQLTQKNEQLAAQQARIAELEAQLSRA